VALELPFIISVTFLHGGNVESYELTQDVYGENAMLISDVRMTQIPVRVGRSVCCKK